MPNAPGCPECRVDMVSGFIPDARLMKVGTILAIFMLLIAASPLQAQENAEERDRETLREDEETIKKEHADETVKKEDGKKISIGGKTPDQVRKEANQERAQRLSTSANHQHQRAAAKASPTTSVGNGVTMRNAEPANPRETTARQDLADRSSMPVGDRVERPPEGSIVVKVGRTQYHYVAGRFYLQQEEKFEIVPPPLGAVIPTRPTASSTVRAGKKRYFYQGGYFYEKAGRAGYRVVAPPVGAVVPYLPKGFTPKVIYGDRYYTFAGAIYNPVTVNGKRYYQVVRIRGR